MKIISDNKGVLEKIRMFKFLKGNFLVLDV